MANFIEKPVFLSNEFKIPISILPDGRYKVKISLLDPKGKVLETGRGRFWKIPPKISKPKDIYTIKKQNIFKNGEFFFPIIGCSKLIGWKELRNRRFDKGRFTKAYRKRLQDLRKMGFNSVYTPLDCFPEMAKMAENSKSMAKAFPFLAALSEDAADALFL